MPTWRCYGCGLNKRSDKARIETTEAGPSTQAGQLPSRCPGRHPHEEGPVPSHHPGPGVPPLDIGPTRGTEGSPQLSIAKEPVQRCLERRVAVEPQPATRALAMLFGRPAGSVDQSRASG